MSQNFLKNKIDLSTKTQQEHLPDVEVVIKETQISNDNPDSEIVEMVCVLCIMLKLLNNQAAVFFCSHI